MESRYRVIYSESVRSTLVDLHRRAALLGLEQTVVAAAKAIDEHLRTDPMAFGDLNFSLREMKLDVFARVFPPLVVYYAVHKTKKLVFVKRIQPAPGAGF